MVPVSYVLDLHRKLREMTVERNMYKRLSEEAMTAILEALGGPRAEGSLIGLWGLWQDYAQEPPPASVEAVEAPTDDDPHAA